MARSQMKKKYFLFETFLGSKLRRVLVLTNMPGLGTIARQRSQQELDYTGKLRVWWHRDGNRTYWYVRTYTSGLVFSCEPDCIYIDIYI